MGPFSSLPLHRQCPGDTHGGLRTLELHAGTILSWRYRDINKHGYGISRVSKASGVRPLTKKKISSNVHYNRVLETYEM